MGVKVCKNCGETFSRQPGRSQAQWDERTLCRRDCRALMTTAAVEAAIARLMRKVSAVPSGCWVWQRKRNRNGYGIVWHRGTRRLAHRVAYEIHLGPIPETAVLHHVCGNRACVNPAHLEEKQHGEHISAHWAARRRTRAQESL